MFDLGLSSNQLEDATRGFSFEKNGPLNMSMGKSDFLASDIINKYSENKIADIIFNYGEERFARKIAKKIVECRNLKIIRNTFLESRAGLQEWSRAMRLGRYGFHSKEHQQNPMTRSMETNLCESNTVKGKI